MKMDDLGVTPMTQETSIWAWLPKIDGYYCPAKKNGCDSFMIHLWLYIYLDNYCKILYLKMQLQ